MKKRISLFVTLINILSLAMFCAFSYSWINREYLNTIQDHMSAMLDVIAQNSETSVKAGQLSKTLSAPMKKDVRVTLISQDGVVLDDSAADVSAMENHGQRSEVQDAIETGWGRDIRKSATTGHGTLYIAKLMQSGDILRLSVTLRSANEFFLALLPLFVALLAALILLTHLFVKMFTKKLLRPFEQLAENISQTIKQKTPFKYENSYEELEPMIQDFKILGDELNSYIISLQSEKQKISDIIGHMSEGLIIVDGNYNVLLINEIVTQMLNLPHNAEEKNILVLCRNVQLQNAIKNVMETKASQTIELLVQKKWIRIILSYVSSGGLVILLNDNTEIRRLETIRSEFFTNVTHELKTPLTSIHGFAELISSGMLTQPEDIKGYCKRILNESNRLIFLIDDILKLSKLENQQEMGHVIRLSLREAFEKTQALLEKQINEKNLAVTINGQAEINSNPDMLYMLVLNLFDNAVKYNKDGGAIEINIGLVDGGVIFTVKDTGIGIADDDKERVFERFYRADKSRSMKVAGTGLGLSIVKHVVARLGGSVALHSKLSEGTEVTIRLPEI